jgi:membrane-associated HD superfamily phosphohydrolase
MAAVTKNRNFFNCPLLKKIFTEKPGIYVKLLLAM